MAPIKNAAPGAARSAADTATDPAPAPVAPAAGDSPAAAVLATLSAEPGGATAAAIAGHAGISVAAARQALLTHEKAGTVTRARGGRPGVPDTWKPAGPAAPRGQARPAEAPAADSTPGGQPAAGDGAADAGQPAPAGGSAAGAEAVAGTAPDPAVTAEAAGNILAVARSADDAGKALAAGDLDAALAALDAARDQAIRGRRALKAAATGRRAPATRSGGLRELVEDHLRKFPDACFTPHQVGKVLTRSSGAVANALDKLVSLGAAELTCDKPRSYRLAPGATAPGPDTADPGAGVNATASAA